MSLGEFLWVIDWSEQPGGWAICSDQRSTENLRETHKFLLAAPGGRVDGQGKAEKEDR